MPRWFLVVVMTTLAAAGQIPAQDGSGGAFKTLESSGEARKKLFHVNKRITGAAKQYTVESKDGRSTSSPADDWDFEAVLDATGNQRYTVTTARGQPQRGGTGFYGTPELYYSVLRDGEPFAIKDFVPRNESPFSYLQRKTGGPAWFASSFDGNRSIDLVGFILAGGDKLTHTLSLGSATRTTKYGKDVLAVPSTLTPKAGIVEKVGGGVVKQTSYFDPANAHAFLGSESAEPATKARPWAHQQICVLEYQPRPGGQPVPKRFTRHVQPEKGEKLLEYEVDFTRYEDYTPTADDFRLEDRYGLTTPAGPGDKTLVGVPSSGRSRAWLSGAILASVMVVGLIGYAVYRRRRPAA
jgi:hypothetical protein